MRKIMPTVVATCAVLALVPASALAHGHRGHHGRHHARTHDQTFGTQPTSTTPSPSAGTVQSFTGGVLTIALSNGSTVSGAVTDATRVICQGSEPAGQQSSSWQSHDGSWGDGGGGGTGDDDQGPGDDDHADQSCSMTDLTTGAVVQEASLRLSSAGATWDVVVLATQPSSTATPTSGS